LTKDGSQIFAAATHWKPVDEIGGMTGRIPRIKSDERTSSPSYPLNNVLARQPHVRHESRTNKGVSGTVIIGKYAPPYTVIPVAFGIRVRSLMLCFGQAAVIEEVMREVGMGADLMRKLAKFTDQL
jgi:hypothetical protein